MIASLILMLQHYSIPLLTIIINIFSKPPVHWVGLPLSSGQVERGLVEVKI